MKINIKIFLQTKQFYLNIKIIILIKQCLLCKYNFNQFYKLKYLISFELTIKINDMGIRDKNLKPIGMRISFFHIDHF